MQQRHNNSLALRETIVLIQLFSTQIEIEKETDHSDIVVDIPHFPLDNKKLSDPKFLQKDIPNSQEESLQLPR